MKIKLRLFSLVMLVVLLAAAHVALAATNLEPGQLFAGNVTVSPDRNDMVPLERPSGELHIYVQGAIESTIEFTAFVSGATTGAQCQIDPEQPIVPGTVVWRTCRIDTQFAADHVLLQSSDTQTINLIVSDGTWAAPTYHISIYIPMISR